MDDKDGKGGSRWSEPIEPGKPVAIDSEGTVVVGRYLEYQSFLQDGKRESRIHEVTLSEGFSIPSNSGLQPGDSFRFWGSYDLDQKLRRIQEGETIRIEFKGVEELPAGVEGNKREMKRFEVRRWCGPTGAPRPRGGTDNPPF